MLARQLPRVIAILDVPDIEYLCASVVAEVRRRFVPDMADSDAAAFLADCLGQIFILHAGDPRAGRPGFDTRRNVPFRLYAYGKLRHFLLDELRSPRGYGRHGQHRVHGDIPGEPGSRPDAQPSVGAGDGAARWCCDLERDRPGAFGEVGSPGRADPRSGRAASRPRPDPDPGSGASGLDRRPGGNGAVDQRVSFLDCPACGWRHYRAAPNGKRAWHFPASCSACGHRLPPELVAVSPVQRHVVGEVAA